MLGQYTSSIPRDEKFFGVLVGDPGIGKTHFKWMATDDYSDVSRDSRKHLYVRRPYAPVPNHRYATTIGSEVHPISMLDTGIGKPVGLLLVDVGCSEKFAELRQYAYRGEVDKFIVAHNGNPKKWMDEILAIRPDAEFLELDMRTMKTSADAMAWGKRGKRRIEG